MDHPRHSPSRPAAIATCARDGRRTDRRLDTPSGTALAGGALLALLAALAPREALADDVPVFTTPPSADQLADILFPPRTRSIVIDGEVSGGAIASKGAAPATAAPAESAAAQGASGQSAFGLLVNFEYGKAEITEASRPYLDSVGQMLNLERAGGQSIMIEGHTDAVGSDAYNLRLSEQRALAVRRYLVSVHRVDERRLRPVGRGEARLHEPADPKAAINRRVEFRLLDGADDDV